MQRGGGILLRVHARMNGWTGEAGVARRGFAALLAAVFCQTCGYWLLTTCVGVVVYRQTGDAFLLALVTAAQSAPALLLSSYAGVLADRFDRRKMLAVVTVLSVGCVAGMAIVAAVGALDALWLAVGVFILGIIVAFDTPARSALVPTLVRPHNIRRAIAAFNTAFGSARLVGPGVAGMVLLWGGPPWALAIAAMLYAGLLPALPLVRSRSGSVESVIVENTPTLREGLAYLQSQPSVHVLAGIALVAGTFGWLPLTLMPAIATDVLGTDTVGLGWLLSATAIGSLVVNASLATGLLRVLKYRWLFVGVGLVVVAISLLAFSTSLPLSLLLCVLLGLSMSGTYTASMGLMHALLIDRYRGRVVGVVTTAMCAAMLPFVGLGALAEGAGLRVGLLGGAALIGLCGLGLLARQFSLRGRREPTTRIAPSGIKSADRSGVEEGGL